jgi:hypothetical protein
MMTRRRGRIVNLTSHAGVFRWPWVSAYAVAKSAVIKLTENLAAEFRREPPLDRAGRITGPIRLRALPDRLLAARHVLAATERRSAAQRSCHLHPRV